ncbi:MAG: HlyD family efflux transporter periplasmic adaptor subunit [Tissierellia bacterium]|nr:HlyD family efflux transporter periplasmic adaptor subunit [Tissierellia bacterium]
MKKKIIFLIGIIIAVLAVLFSVLMKDKNINFGNTAKVKLGTIQKTIEETGTVFSKRVNTFYSDTSQIVKTLNVSIGNEVKKGDVILTYENNYDLEIERYKKQIDALTAVYNESVKGADFQEVSNEKLNINTIENNLEYAKRNFEKIKTLYENYVVSKAELDEAENNVKILENQLLEAKNNYDLLVKDVSSNIKKEYEAQIEEIMVQISILEKSKQQASIIAEFDGVITELNVHQGGMTKPGVIVVEIQDQNNLGIYVELLAEEVSEVKEGMPLVLNGNSTPLDLVVNRIYPKASSKISDLGVEQKRVRVEADLKENKTNLKIGTEIDVKIIIEQKDNVLLLDKNSVYEYDEKKYVNMMSDENKIEIEVTTGIEDENNIEITSGLKENDEVLINN